MTEEATLCGVPSASSVHSGSISLLRLNGGAWRATVSHHNGHQVHPFDDWKDDPVEALRIALVEDERLSRDLARRYEGTPKVGGDTKIERAPVAGELPVIDPEFDDMDGMLG